jgi:hypothetical protein
VEAAMKTFYCDACGNLVFFENTSCVNCGKALGFLPDVLDLSAMAPEAEGHERALAKRAQARRYRRCANDRNHQVCNWRVAEEDPAELCCACRLNDIIPDLSVAGNRERWHRLEFAKRRLIYTLLALRLPFTSGGDDGAAGLQFRFMDAVEGVKPVTGHAHGIITINIMEADDAVREKQRVSLHEPLRTLLGHFRHEAAHYYWERLVAGSTRLQRFRELFGDERANYAEALQRHYQAGPPADWSKRHITAYASAHPWEDWAETSAHYLHILDAIETAASFGLSLHPTQHPAADTMTAEPRRTMQPEAGFEALLSTWFPLSYALNSLNRGVGLPDLYPFVLGDVTMQKMRFVHEVITEASASGRISRR